MNRKSSPTTAANIFWEEVPEELNTIKNVLPHGTYQEPGKILNSTTVQAETKPWLRPVRPRKPHGRVAEKEFTSTNHKLKPPYSSPVLKEVISSDQIFHEASLKYKSSSVKEKRSMETKAKESITLKHLCKEDKQKVATLIKELSKFSEEKENAIEKYNKATHKYKKTIKSLETEKQAAIKEQDLLKERILEYEIYLKEHEQERVKNQAASTDTSSPPVDQFTQVFSEQQQKFKEQQDVLQSQIVQLQKLQESLLGKQEPDQSVNLKENFRRKSPLQVAFPGNQNISELDEYLINEVHKENLSNPNVTSTATNTIAPKGFGSTHAVADLSFSRGQVPTATCNVAVGTSPVENTGIVVNPPNFPINNHDRSDISVQTENLPASNKSLKAKNSTSNLPAVIDDPNCITYSNEHTASQTDSTVNEKRLEECEKSISLLEQSLSYAISLNTQPHTKSNQVVEQGSYTQPSILTRSHATHITPVQQGPHHQQQQRKSRSILATSEKRKNRTVPSSRKTKQSNSKTLLETLLDASSTSASSSDENTDLPPSTFPSSEIDRITNSAIKRKHFKSSSMMELAAGLQPRSTSTSVDQYSLYGKNGKSMRSTNSITATRSTSSSTREKELHRIYSSGGGGVKKSKTRVVFDEDSDNIVDERNVLEDVFFVK